MNKFFFVLVFTFLFGMFNSTDCQAENPDSHKWLYVVTSDTDEEFYFYFSDLYKNRKLYESNQSVRSFQIWEWHEQQSGSHTLVRMEYDLEKERFTLLECVDYTQDGKLIGKSVSPTKEWANIVPETVGMRMFEALKLFVEDSTGL